MKEQNQVQSQESLPVQSSPPVPPQPHAKPKWFIIVLILIVLIALGGFGGKYYLDQQKLQAITDFESCIKAGNPVTESYPSTCRTRDGRMFIQKLSSDEQKNLQLPSPTSDPTENWKTYKSTKLGLSFKYPEKYALEEVSTGQYKSREGTAITLSGKEDNIYLGYALGRGSEMLLKTEDFAVTNFPATRQYYGSSLEKVSSQIITIDKEKDYKIELIINTNSNNPLSVSEIKTFDQILSTFTFTQ